ncbi:MAG: hypothetical protein LBF38_01685 [Deltaproteobacteria bacterium]|jgi:hypothetical protein|nr:hypothetical protein [Deltaproteobacteria bacterium]
MKPIRKLAIGALGLFPIAFMTGCANKVPPTFVSCSTPVGYLQDVAEPELKGKTNKDLIEHVVELREALKRSNLDKFHLSEWAEDQLNP